MTPRDEFIKYIPETWEHGDIENDWIEIWPFIKGNTEHRFYIHCTDVLTDQDYKASYTYNHRLEGNEPVWEEERPYSEAIDEVLQWLDLMLEELLNEGNIYIKQGNKHVQI